MDLELHQLDRRYEALRTRSARRERRLLASLSEVGQQTPIVVVRDGAAMGRRRRLQARARAASAGPGRGARDGVGAERGSRRCCSSGCCAAATATARSSRAGCCAS